MAKQTSRTLEEADVNSFLTAADQRRPPNIIKLYSIIDELSIKNPFRCHRMEKDLKWLEKQMQKHGVGWNNE